MDRAKRSDSAGRLRRNPFAHRGHVTRFRRDGARYLIEIEGPDGLRRAYEVLGVAGIDPLQQYLLSPAPGRLQAYDIAWDTRQGGWFPVLSGPRPRPSEGFHWTGSYNSWAARCAECHATAYSRNFDPERATYAPRMAETGVGCEACHGPGAAHLEWARTRARVVAGLTPTGFTVDPAASQGTEVMGCLACRSRREAMQDGIPVPGTDYHDAFSPDAAARRHP